MDANVSERENLVRLLAKWRRRASAAVTDNESRAMLLVIDEFCSAVGITFDEEARATWLAFGPQAVKL